MQHTLKNSLSLQWKFLSKDHLPAVAVAIASLMIAVLMISPFFIASGGRFRVLHTHDMPTLLSMMVEFDNAFRAGALYPRWLADANFGYGFPGFVFYPSGLFYLATFFHSVIKNWYAVTFVVCVVALAASGIGLYALSRLYHGKAASAVAALLYMLFPYHLLDLYWRGAVPEFIGFAIMPMMLYFFLRVGNEGKLQHYAGLGFFYGIHLLTHLPVGYMFTYALAFYAFIWTLKKRDPKVAFRLACGMALGLLLSAVYWLPAALEGKYIYEPVTEIFPYHESYITFNPPGNYFDSLVQRTFVFQLAATAIAIAVLLLQAILLWRSRNAQQDEPAETERYPQVGLWIIMAVVTTLMSTQFSMPVSKLIPKIQIAVPAWRWWAIAILFTSLLFAAAIEQTSKRFNLPWALSWSLRIMLLIVVAANIWLSVKGVIMEKMSSGEWVFGTDFAGDGFIPVFATRPYEMPKTERAIVSPIGSAEVLVWQPQYREVDTTANGNGTLRLKTYNFPGWQATLDGEPAPILSDPNGSQVIRIPAGKHKVTTRFVNTPPRIIGATLFWLGLLVIIGLTIIGRRRKDVIGNEESANEAMSV